MLDAVDTEAALDGLRFSAGLEGALSLSLSSLSSSEEEEGLALEVEALGALAFGKALGFFGGDGGASESDDHFIA